MTRANPNAIKMFGLIARRPDMSEEQFHDYYRHPHATMGRRISTSRNYVQSHQIDCTLLGPGQKRYDAVAEIWVENMDDLGTFREEPIMRDFTGPDELNFIDYARSDMVGTHEEVLISRPKEGQGFDQADLWWSPSVLPNSIKMLVLMTKDAVDWVNAIDIDLARRLGVFRQTRCLAIPIGGEEISSSPFLGVHELWWPTVTRFQDSIDKDRAAWQLLCARTERSVTMLARAERLV